MWKIVGITFLVVLGIGVSKLPVSMWTTAGEASGQLVSYAGEKLAGGFEWVAASVSAKERETATMYADAVSERVAPVVVEGNRQIVESLTRNNEQLARNLARQTGMLNGITMNQAEILVQTRNGQNAIAGDIRLIANAVDEVQHGLIADIAPAILDGNRQLAETLAKSTIVASVRFEREVELLDETARKQDEILAETRAGNDFLAEHLEQIQDTPHGVGPEVSSDLSRFAIHWRVSESGTVRRCRMVPLGMYTQAMGPAVETCVVGEELYRLVPDAVIRR